MLHRLYRGVYAVGHVALSEDARAVAAIFAYGGDAFVSHLSAAKKWNISRWTNDSLRLVTSHRRAPLSGIKVIRVGGLFEDEFVDIDGVATASVERTILDLSRNLDEYQLAWVLHQAKFHRVLNQNFLDVLIGRHTNFPGRQRLRQAIRLREAGSAGTRSRAEDYFVQIIRSFGIKIPRVNTHVQTVAGPFEVDFYWHSKRIGIEVDGPDHEDLAVQLSDQARDEQLRLAGVQIFRFSTKRMYRMTRNAVAVEIHNCIA